MSMMCHNEAYEVQFLYVFDLADSIRPLAKFQYEQAIFCQFLTLGTYMDDKGQIASGR